MAIAAARRPLNQVSSPFHAGLGHNRGHQPHRHQKQNESASEIHRSYSSLGRWYVQSENFLTKNRVSASGVTPNAPRRGPIPGEGPGNSKARGLSALWSDLYPVACPRCVVVGCVQARSRFVDQSGMIRFAAGGSSTQGPSNVTKLPLLSTISKIGPPSACCATRCSGKKLPTWLAITAGYGPVNDRLQAPIHRNIGRSDMNRSDPRGSPGTGPRTTEPPEPL